MMGAIGIYFRFWLTKIQMMTRFPARMIHLPTLLCFIAKKGKRGVKYSKFVKEDGVFFAHYLVITKCS